MRAQWNVNVNFLNVHMLYMCFNFKSSGHKFPPPKYASLIYFTEIYSMYMGNLDGLLDRLCETGRSMP